MFRPSLLAATALATGILIGALAVKPWQVVAQATPDDAKTYEQLRLFSTVFERVRESYVEPVEDEKLIESAINGMLSALDPHSSYMNAEQFQDMQVQTRGEFGGLGIEVTMQDGLVRVIAPMDGTPAAAAGIEAGDLISAIDDQPVMGLSLNDAVDKMRGEVGAKIKLTILRGEQEPFDVTLERAIITIKSVRWELEDGNIGYVRINSFSENTDEGLRDAVEQLRSATKDKLAGLVLDLRNNPGGLLDQAIAVSDDFLEKGEIVSTRGRHTDETQRWNAEPGDLIGGKPLIILINAGSASASEIVSGALQDHRRALILGVKSFGKGSVQTILPIPGHGAMRLTTARYYTPSGRSIQAKGIEPDILVEPAKVEKLQGGKTFHEADLKGALENPDAAPAENAPAPTAETAKPQAPVIGSEKTEIAKPDEDYQLARALDLVKGLSLLTGDSAN